MDPEEILCTQCGDLVSLTRLEPALLHLLQNRSAGEWVPVAELYRIAGENGADIRAEVAAAWLPSPTNQPGYVIIFFCDDELQWSMTAYYNAARLLESITPPAAAPGPAR